MGLMDELTTCPAHPDVPAVTECASCERDLCAACWAFDVDGRPACSACVRHLRERSPAVLPLSFGGLALCFLFPFVGELVDLVGEWGCLLVLVVLGSACGFMYLRERRARVSRAVTERADVPAESAAPEPSGGSPYRGGVPRRRVFEELLPVWSGELAALAILGSLLAAAALATAALEADPEIEIEVVLLCAWLVWFVAFTVILFRGRRIADDHGLLEVAKAGADATPVGVIKTVAMVPMFLSSAGGPGGIAVGVVVGVLLAIPLAAGLALALVVPLLFVLSYAVLGRAIRLVTNDAPRCRGHLGRSALRAALFATAYTVPLALPIGVMWLVRVGAS